MQLNSTFDPTEFNFMRLRDYRIPPDVSVYEFQSHPIVAGKKDFLRLNLYLTKDNDYVTVWKGLLDPLLTAAEFESGRMASAELPADFDFRSYNEDLFRGYIDSREAAECIFKALRIGNGRMYSLPQALTTDSEGKLRCDWVEERSPKFSLASVASCRTSLPYQKSASSFRDTRSPVLIPALQLLSASPYSAFRSEIERFCGPSSFSRNPLKNGAKFNDALRALEFHE